jgi:PKD repeat protein
MRLSKKVILFGIALIPLILIYSSFPHMADTYASLSDTKHVDVTLTAAIWDTQNSLVGLFDLKLPENGTNPQKINLGTKGNSNTEVADNNSSAGNFSNNGSSDNNLDNNISALGNDTFNLTTENLTADSLTNNTTSNNYSGMGGGSSGSTSPGQSSQVLPVANFSSNISSGYAPLTVQSTDQSQNATRWSWDFGDGDTSTSQNPLHTYYVAGSYTVTLSASNKNGTISTFSTITVQQPALPIANFVSNVSSGYTPLSVQFTDQSQNAAGWSWDFGDGNTSIAQSPVHSYSLPGIYNVNLIVTNVNGTNSKSGTIIVLQPVPVLLVANFISSVTNGYAPLSVQFTDRSGNATGWNWDFGDGGTSISQSPVHTYSVAGNYTVNLTANNVNGTNSKSGTIIVLQPVPVLLVANFISNITFGYVPLTVQFTDQSQNAIGWNWDFGDGGTSISQSPVHTYSVAGNYTVNLTANNVNGTNSKSGTITVLQPASVLPVANFISNVSSGYAPLTVQFTDRSENATGWSWDFGDGNTSTTQNPVHIFSVAGNYTVDLTAANAKGQSKKQAQFLLKRKHKNTRF